MDAADTAPPSGVTVRASRVRSWWMSLHLHGGLVCFWYLIVFGVTTLRFNHPGILPEKRGPAIHWERPLTVPDQSDNLKLSEAVQHDLDLVGWVLSWEIHRTPSGDVRFELVRPGRRYLVETDRAGARTTVEEQSTGLGPVLQFLHGPTEGIPGTRVLHLWGAYTEVTAWLVAFLSASGVVLWWRRSRNRLLAAVTLALGLLVSAALMLRVWIAG